MQKSKRKRENKEPEVGRVVPIFMFYSCCNLKGVGQGHGNGK